MFHTYKFFRIGLFVLFLVCAPSSVEPWKDRKPRYGLECNPALIFLSSARFFQKPA